MTLFYLPNTEQSRSILKIWNGAALLPWLLNQTLPKLSV
jgi:hypothetical protein